MTLILMLSCCLALVLPLLVSSAPVCILPQDCDEIYRNGTRLSGVYKIHPTGDATGVDVYCDMRTTDDQPGGWTVFQRRIDGSVNFYRPWDPYRNGFGDKSGEYWLGLENLYQITHKRNYELRVDLEDFEGFKAFALYTSFSVDTEMSGYILHVSGFINGGAGDSLAFHNGQKFSTMDRDQDASPSNCARQYLGAFWYNNCHHANPNGMYLRGRDGTYIAVGDVWLTWRAHDYSLKSITMKIRPVA